MGFTLFAVLLFCLILLIPARAIRFALRHRGRVALEVAESLKELGDEGDDERISWRFVRREGATSRSYELHVVIEEMLPFPPGISARADARVPLTLSIFDGTYLSHRGESVLVHSALMYPAVFEPAEVITSLIKDSAWGGVRDDREARTCTFTFVFTTQALQRRPGHSKEQDRARIEGELTSRISACARLLARRDERGDAATLCDLYASVFEGATRERAALLKHILQNHAGEPEVEALYESTLREEIAVELLAVLCDVDAERFCSGYPLLIDFAGDYARHHDSLREPVMETLISSVAAAEPFADSFGPHLPQSALLRAEIPIAYRIALVRHWLAQDEGTRARLHDAIRQMTASDQGVMRVAFKYDDALRGALSDSSALQGGELSLE